MMCSQSSHYAGSSADCLSRRLPFSCYVPFQAYFQRNPRQAMICLSVGAEPAKRLIVFGSPAELASGLAETHRWVGNQDGMCGYEETYEKRSGLRLKRSHCMGILVKKRHSLIPFGHLLVRSYKM